jgi:hypothetical protein
MTPSDPNSPTPPPNPLNLEPYPDPPLPPGNRKHDPDRIFIGPNGLRAGWRLCIWLCLSIAFIAISVLIVKHVPFLNRQVSGKADQLGPWSLIISEGSVVWGVFVAALIMSAIEGRKPGAYGLPATQAFKSYFWQGILWGLAQVSLLVGLIYIAGGYNFGALALATPGIITNGILFFVGFLLVGFFEEFSFRGYSQFTLSTGIGFWPSAIILSALFGAIHLGNPGEGLVGALSVFSIAMFFCLTLRRTGTLWFAVGLHCSFDWGETFLYSVPNSGTSTLGALSHSALHGPRWLTGGSVGPEGSVFCFLTIALDFFVFLALYRARPSLPATPSDLSTS